MRPIDADALLKKTINNPLHAPYIVEKDIREMPTIQPEPQWIPCSERMPNKTPYWKTVGYLATVTCDSWKESQTMYVKWETTTVRGKEVSRWTFDSRLFPSEWNVVAWMSLPVPYQSGGEKDVRKPD